MKKTKQWTLLSATNILFVLLIFLSAAQAQTGDLTADELKSASQPVQARLQKSRQLINSQKLNYWVGLTEVSELPLKKITGEIPPADLKSLATKQNALVAKKNNISVTQLATFDFTKVDRSKLRLEDSKLPVLEVDQYGNKTDKNYKPKAGAMEKEEKKESNPAPKCDLSKPTWDSRSIPYLFLPSVRNQKQCGSCWVFAAQGAFESSPFTTWKGNPYNTEKNSKPSSNTSEQYTLDMSDGGDCEGGYTYKALEFLIKNGSVDESMVPYKADKGSPDSLKSLNLYNRVWKISTYAFVNPDVQVPSVAEIKNAICQHRVVTSSMYASEEFKDYVGGVWGHSAANEKAQAVVVGFKTNHAVLIIGWDDTKQSWLVKNSWGTNWGETGGTGKERGYVWVRYGNAGIGSAAMWVE